MEMLPISAFRSEFLRRAEWRKDDDRRAIERDIKLRKDKEERDKRDDRDRGMDEILAVVMATETEIADFTVTLDVYDAATVEALQKNEEQLIKVREELTRMLDKAYVLSDGRKVFKTEDGLHVFDEHGIEVKDFDPNEIEAWRPSYEKFFETTSQHQQLTTERAQLLDYQAKLDDARERTEDAEHPLTHNELVELKAGLEKTKPDAVKLALGEPTEADASAKSEVGFDPASLAPLRKQPAPTPSA